MADTKTGPRGQPTAAELAARDKRVVELFVKHKVSVQNISIRMKLGNATIYKILDDSGARKAGDHRRDLWT